ncbi:MAG: M16 family metallopeptidase [Actinomycetes bacterium]
MTLASGPAALVDPRPVPPLGKVRRARLPTVAERVLPTGLRVVAVRRPSVPVVHLRLRVPTAVRRDADLAKARLLERTMLLGTAERSQAEIAEALQRVGGSLRVSSDADRLLVAGEALAGGVPDLLALLAEVLTGAAYPREQVEGEAARLADQTRRALAQPGVVADESWLRRAFGGHPYGREHPSPDEVLAVTPPSLRAAHRRRLVPDGSLLVLVGDLSPARTLDRVESALAGWDSAGGATLVPRVPPMEPGPLVLVDRPGAVQSNLRVGGPAVARTDPDYPSVELANALFGGYFGSRLTLNIREDKGYTYSPRSSLQHGSRASFLLLQVDVATEVTAPALLEVGYELGRLASLPPSADEVRDTAQYLVGVLALSTSTQAGLAGTLATLLSDGLDVSWLREHPQRVLAVSPEDVHAQARRVLAPAGLVTTVVGDSALVEEPLRALTEVEPR